VNWRWLLVGCFVVALLGGPAVGAAGTAPPAVERDTTEQFLHDLKNPLTWWTWGADLRIQQEYIYNAVDLESSDNDTLNMLRARIRLWTQLGPFMSLRDVPSPNGLSFYARLTYEPRYLIQGIATDLFAEPPRVPAFDEAVWDSLYVDWTRILGTPVSLRVGRFDLGWRDDGKGPEYGRAFIIGEGTPLDASRTVYSDAVRMRIHLDSWQSTLDLFFANNKGRQSRFRPISDDGRLVSEFDSTLFGAYFINRSAKDQEVHAYYVYKDEDAIADTTLPGRIVHTAGLLAQGKIESGLDYYGEAAYQWGKEGSEDRQGFGFSSEVGYTMKDATWVPRLYAAYEYLSGDDPDTSKYEGWDPVMSRWARWSELYAYRWAVDEGRLAQWTNLQRLGVGVGVKPTEKMSAGLDFSVVLTQERQGAGRTRGELTVAKLAYQFSKRVSGGLWAEYFHPGSFYPGADDALYLRWSLNFEL